MSSPNFCPNCGSTLIEQRSTNGRPDQWLCANPACGARQYLNAKPCAGVLVEQAGRVLLVRRTIEPYRDDWDIPGGFLEEQEHPTDGARREVLEETGLDVELTGLLGIFIDSYGDSGLTTFNCYYRARVSGGTLHPADETAEVGWFAPDNLPANIAFPGHIPHVLRVWRAAFLRDPAPDPAADFALFAHLQ